MTTINLPEWPWQTVRRLAERRGVRVWLVGGAVRDALLNRPVHDWDFAVDRDASALARAVGDAVGGAYFPLDEERGTSRVVLKAEDDARLEIDFALLRGADLMTDLAARDFTINAMAVGQHGALIDPLDGRADLESRCIRATNEQALRDDPLRLLRAARIEAELNFEIEPQTAAWIKRHAPSLSTSAVERIRDEFTRGLAVPGGGVFTERLDDLSLLPHIVPELEALKQVEQTFPHRFDVWQHTLVMMSTLENVWAAVRGASFEHEQHTHRRPLWADVPLSAWGDVARRLGQFADELGAHLAVEICADRDRMLLLKLAALLHDIGKPQTQSRDEDGRIHFYNHGPVGAKMVGKIMQRLRFSHEEGEHMRTMVEAHLRPAHLARAEKITRRAIYRYFRDTGAAGVGTVLLSIADHLSSWGPNLQEQRWARRLDMAELLMHHYFERHEEAIAPPPLIDGHDLMDALDLPEGPEIGRLLRILQEAQAAGEIETRQEALEWAARAKNAG